MTLNDYVRSLPPEAQQVGSKKYMWDKHRVELLRSILAFLRERPLVPISAGNFIIHMNFASFFLIIFSVLIHQLFADWLSNLNTISNLQRVRYNNLEVFLENSSKIDLNLFLPSEYLKGNENQAYEDIDYFLVKAPLKMFSEKISHEYSLDKIATICCIDSEDSLFPKATTFNSSTMDGALIIFDHRPDECGPIQNFIFLHEIGHSLFAIGKIPFYSKNVFFITIASLFAAISIFKPSFILFTIFLIPIVFCGKEILLDNIYRVLKEEIVCDHFSISYMSFDDVNKIASHPGILSRFQDITLSDHHNQIRLDYLKKFIDLKIRRENEELETAVYENDFFINKPNFFILTLVSVSYIILGSNLIMRDVGVWLAIVILLLILAMFLWSRLEVLTLNLGIRNLFLKTKFFSHDK